MQKPPPTRRLFVVLFLAILSVPSIGMLFTNAETRSAVENRLLAPAPAWPRQARDWVALPHAIDSYLRDHFAFRRLMTTADARLRWRLGGQMTKGAVVQGKNDRMFLNEDLPAILGSVPKPEAAADYGRLLCRFNRLLQTRNVRLLFSMAPSAAEIYPEDLPNGMPSGRLTQYDLVLAEARSCGVNAVDLRPAIRDAKPQGNLFFRHDSHWTTRGALVAFDQLVAAMGRLDWVISPSQLRWVKEPAGPADLVRMAGALGVPPEWTERPEISEGNAKAVREPLAGIKDDGVIRAYIETTGHEGPTVLFIGDSYSADFMPAFFAPHVSRFAWVHQHYCSFDWHVLDLVRPDYVVIMPVDRLAWCRKREPAANRPSG